MAMGSFTWKSCGKCSFFISHTATGREGGNTRPHTYEIRSNFAITKSTHSIGHYVRDECALQMQFSLSPISFNSFCNEIYNSNRSYTKLMDCKRLSESTCTVLVRISRVRTGCARMSVCPSSRMCCAIQCLDLCVVCVCVRLRKCG